MGCQPDYLCQWNCEHYIVQIVTHLGSGWGANYNITRCHFLCCSHTVFERTGSLQEAARIPLGSLEVCPLSSLPFHLAHAPEGREHVPGFTIRSADKPSKWAKNTSSIARLSQKWKVKTFLLFAIRISLCWKQLSDTFFWERRC